MNKLVLTLRVALLVMLPAAARAQAPANDNFFNAIPLNGPIVTTSGSNVGASKNFFQEPFFAGNPGGASFEDGGAALIGADCRRQ